MTKFADFHKGKEVKSFTSGAKAGSGEKSEMAHPSLAKKWLKTGIMVAVISSAFLTGCVQPPEKPLPEKPAVVMMMPATQQNSLRMSFDARLATNFDKIEGVEAAIDSTRKQMLSGKESDAFVNYHADSLKVDYNNRITASLFYAGLGSSPMTGSGGGIAYSVTETNYKKDFKEKVGAEQAQLKAAQNKTR